jgi:hypothetical protein
MALAEIWNAEDRRHALDAMSSFKAAYGAKLSRAVAKITDDLEVLLAGASPTPPTSGGHSRRPTGCRRATGALKQGRDR